MEEDHGQHSPTDVERVVEPEHRDQRHLERDYKEPDHADEGPVATRKVEPGERVARERAHDDDECSVADGDVGRGLERRRQPGVVNDVAVVRERRQARVGEDLPPAFGSGLGLRQDRGDEKADRRHQPEQADYCEQDLQRRLREPAQDLRRHAVARTRDDDRLGAGNH